MDHSSHSFIYLIWHCLKSAQYLSTYIVLLLFFAFLTSLLCHYVTCLLLWCWKGHGVSVVYEKTDSIYLSFPSRAALPVTPTMKPQWQLWPRLHVIFQLPSVVQPLGPNVDPGRSCRDYFYWGKFSHGCFGSKPGSDIPRIESWNLNCLFQVI